ncbi:cell division protein PerM [Jidongwangia harbinensis]|uniref:cell division protein PerM n=1 Tax=Jidongwangia harbinensis TaxID=2878561 RepID=UPI001CDA2CF0|nr:DUF6350 family protein [Jidongwangia harbinensis]MCA2218568.1 DUF6350 family protein [Jidongwangia harbinensis]
MPITPDRPDGPDGSEDLFEVAEATGLADTRETVRVARARSGEPAAAPGGADDDLLVDDVRETVPVDVSRHRTQGIDVADRATVRIDPQAGNRETVKLSRPRRPADRSGRAPLAVAAGFATLWAALLSYLPVTAAVGLARTLEGDGGLGGAAEAGLAGWLLGHGVPLGTSLGPLGLPPLLLSLLIGWRLIRAGLHVTRAIGARHSGSFRDALLVAGAVGLWYAALGTATAMVVNGPGHTVVPSRAAVYLLIIGTGGALIGSLRSTDTLMVLAHRIPPVARHGLRTGMVAALLVLAAGAAFTGLSVAVGAGQAADMFAAFRTGVVGQAGITLVSLAYGANGAVWAAAYLLGPGFSLGADTSIRVTEVTVGPLPTLPLLAGLPDGPMGATGAALLAVPVAAGMFAGWMLTRRLVTQQADVAGPAWSRVLGSALLAGPVAGLVLGALARISGGPLGDGRMAQVGPVAWQVMLAGAVVVAVSATVGAAAARAFRATPRR